MRTRVGAAIAGVVIAAGAWAAIGTAGPARAAVSGGTWGPGMPIAGLAALVPAGQPANGYIHAVTCFSTGNCAAVGYYATEKSSASGSASILMPLVVTETDGTWGNAQTITGAAGLGSGTTAELNLVSCGAAGDCSAAGYFKASDGREHAFYVSAANDSWGTATAVDDSALGTSQMTLLSALSCTGPGDCSAVGGSENEGTHDVVPVTVGEAAGTWGPMQVLPGLTSLSSATGYGSLGSLSCTASGQCTAGGSYATSSGGTQPFLVAESQDSPGNPASPGTWGVPQAVPGFSALSNSADAFVTSVSCGEATDCAVAGVFGGSSTSLGQVFTVDESGGTWGPAEQLSIPGTALPVGDFAPQVSCSPWLAANCAITGISSPTGTTASPRDFVATESASGAWGAAQAVPGIPAGDDSIAYAVSCDPSGGCTVAGNYSSTSGGAAADFTAAISPDGTVGNAQPLPAPAGDSGFGTVFLDCPQAGYCTLTDSLPSGSPLVVTEATAATVTLTVTPPGTVVYGSENAAVFHLVVTSPAGGTPTGTVTVTYGTTPVCTAGIDGQGQCGPSPAALPVGTGTLTATYSGDATYAPATSTTSVTVSAAPAVSYYNPLSPVRLLDTRNGTGAVKAPVGPGKTIALQVTGRGGVPATGVTSVVLNVTATGPTAGGFVTVYPDGQPRPTEGSDLNFTKGETIANLVTVPVGSDGKVDLYNSAGRVSLVADLQGYYTTSGGSPLDFNAQPVRILDTRNGTGGVKTPLGPGKTISLLVANNADYPSPTNTVAVVMNVTATGPTAGGFITVYPAGQPRPAQASNLNFAKGETIANLVITRVSSNGYVDLYNGSGGTVNLVVDWEDDYSGASGPGLVSAGPVGVLDTRTGTGGFTGPVGPGQSIALQVTGPDGVPGGITEVILNVTATDPAKGGYVSVYPDGQGGPLKEGSNLNFTTGETIPNLVMVKVGNDGKVDLYNGSGGTVNLVADLQGYFMEN